MLAELRSSGVAGGDLLQLGWDLAEAVDEAGLRVGRPRGVRPRGGSAQAAPLIYDRTIEQIGVDPSRAVFVGDTWGPDVEGPLAAGMTPVYLRRHGHWPDHTCPHPDPRSAGGVEVVTDLTAIPGLASAPRLT